MPRVLDVRAYAADSSSVRAGIWKAGSKPRPATRRAQCAFETRRPPRSRLPAGDPAGIARKLRQGGRAHRRARSPAEMSEHYRGISPVPALTRMVEAGGGRGRGAALPGQQLAGTSSVRGAKRPLIDPDPSRASRPEPDAGGDPARPQVTHRPAAGAQPELSLQTVARLRRIAATTGNAPAARNGDGEAAAELCRLSEPAAAGAGDAGRGASCWPRWCLRSAAPAFIAHAATS